MSNSEEELRVIYPDIKLHTDRWKNKRFTSELVNAIVDKCEIRFSCGCCYDSPLEVWPYLETSSGPPSLDTSSGRVYSKPPRFIVGEKYLMGYGCIPTEGWQKLLIKNLIPEVILNQVTKYFKDNPPEDEV